MSKRLCTDIEGLHVSVLGKKAETGETERKIADVDRTISTSWKIKKMSPIICAVYLLCFVDWSRHWNRRKRYIPRSGQGIQQVRPWPGAILSGSPSVLQM